MLTREQAIDVLEAVRELSVPSEDYKNYIDQIIDCIYFETFGFHVWGEPTKTVEEVNRYIEGEEVDIEKIADYAYVTLTSVQSEDNSTEDK